MSSATPISHSGVIRDTYTLARSLSCRGFSLVETEAMMADTGIVIGGGLATHVLIKEAGHDVGSLPCASDIDFYVYGCIPSSVPFVPYGQNLFENPEWAKYDADCRVAKAMKAHVMSKFMAFAHKAGYEIMCDDPESDNYAVETTVEGDRLFTSGGKVRYMLLCLKRHLGDAVTDQKLNLVFVDTPLQMVMTKVDLGLTAGFLTASHSGYWMYHHAAPDDINTLSVRWLQPESTHTPRQRARMVKYAERYSKSPLLILTAPQFIAEYDDLPENSKITLTLASYDELLTKAVDRRIRGLSHAAVFYYTLPGGTAPIRHVLIG